MLQRRFELLNELVHSFCENREADGVEATTSLEHIERRFSATEGFLEKQQRIVKDVAQFHTFLDTHPDNVEKEWMHLLQRIADHGQQDKVHVLQELRTWLLDCPMQSCQRDFQHRILSFLLSASGKALETDASLRVVWSMQENLKAARAAEAHLVKELAEEMNQSEDEWWTNDVPLSPGDNLSIWSGSSHDDASRRRSIDLLSSGRQTPTVTSPNAEAARAWNSQENASSDLINTKESMHVIPNDIRYAPLSSHESVRRLLMNKGFRPSYDSTTEIKKNSRKPSHPYGSYSLTLRLASNNTQRKHPAEILDPRKCFEETEIVEDVLRMLEGVDSPGRVFSWDHGQKKYCVLEGIHTRHLTQETMYGILSNFATMASRKRRIVEFCNEILNERSETKSIDASSCNYHYRNTSVEAKSELSQVSTINLFLSFISEALKGSLDWVLKLKYRMKKLEGKLSLIMLEVNLRTLKRHMSVLHSLVEECQWQGSPSLTSISLIKGLYKKIDHILVCSGSSDGFDASIVAAAISASTVALLNAADMWTSMYSLDFAPAEFFLSDIESGAGAYSSSSYENCSNDQTLKLNNFHNQNKNGRIVSQGVAGRSNSSTTPSILCLLEETADDVFRAALSFGSSFNAIEHFSSKLDSAYSRTLETTKANEISGKSSCSDIIHRLLDVLNYCLDSMSSNGDQQSCRSLNSEHPNCEAQLNTPNAVSISDEYMAEKTMDGGEIVQNHICYPEKALCEVGNPLDRKYTRSKNGEDVISHFNFDIISEWMASISDNASLLAVSQKEDLKPLIQLPRSAWDFSTSGLDANDSTCVDHSHLEQRMREALSRRRRTNCDILKMNRDNKLLRTNTCTSLRPNCQCKNPSTHHVGHDFPDLREEACSGGEVSCSSDEDKTNNCEFLNSKWFQNVKAAFEETRSLGTDSSEFNQELVANDQNKGLPLQLCESEDKGLQLKNRYLVIDPVLWQGAPNAHVLLNECFMRPFKSQIQNVEEEVCASILKSGLRKQLDAVCQVATLSLPSLEPFVNHAQNFCAMLQNENKISFFEIDGSLQTALAINDKEGWEYETISCINQANVEIISEEQFKPTHSEIRSESDVCNSEGMSLISIKICPKDPLAFFAKDNFFALHTRLSAFMLKLKWVHYTLVKARSYSKKAHPDIGRTDDTEATTIRLKNSCQQEIHAIQHEMQHFFDCLKMSTEIHLISAGRILDDDLAKAKTMAEIEFAITRYCALISESVLLESPISYEDGKEHNLQHQCFEVLDRIVQHSMIIQGNSNAPVCSGDGMAVLRSIWKKFKVHKNNFITLTKHKASEVAIGAAMPAACLLSEALDATNRYPMTLM